MWFVLVAGFFGVMFAAVAISRALGLSDSQRRDNADELRATGEPAHATVVTIDDTGGRYNRHPVVQFVVTVERPGHTPYQAAFVDVVKELAIPRVQPGCRVPVIVDRADPTRVVLGPM